MAVVNIEDDFEIIEPLTTVIQRDEMLCADEEEDRIEMATKFGSIAVLE